MRQADKPPLATAILKHATLPEVEADVVRTEHYVLDGGSLLHRPMWTKGMSYEEIATQYCTFTLRCYTNVSVVFDGYTDGPSIKDSTHCRRQRAKGANLISVTPNAISNGKREDFLSENSNKQALIGLISETMTTNGIQVLHASSDADVLICKEAIMSSKEKSTTLIGEDTDLLILCLYYSWQFGLYQWHKLYFRSDKRSV